MFVKATSSVMAGVDDNRSKEDVHVTSQRPSPDSDTPVLSQHTRGRQRSSFIDVDNPLRGVELEAAVRRFASETGLSSLFRILLRGAYLAEDPDNYLNIDGLSEADLEALRREYEEVKPLRILAKIPKQLRTIIITCSVAAITQYV